MTRTIRAAGLAAAALAGMTALAEAPEKDKPKGEVLKTVIGATAAFDKDGKTLVVTAVGQVPTGGWTGAKLTRREAKEAPKDGVYEFDLTAVRPDGIVTQALSKVTATEKWENPPADLKAVKINGADKGAKTVPVERK
ncbi:MAG: hypothetical protein C0501_15940 [Isosphaera sp.]|nr:hypothetical protein [Isosphaera sp.]